MFRFHIRDWFIWITEIAVIIKCFILMSGPAASLFGAMTGGIIAAQFHERKFKYRRRLHIATMTITITAVLLTLVEQILLYWP